MAVRGYFQTRIPRERNLTTGVLVFDTVGCLAERSPFRLKTGPFCFQAKMADETEGKKERKKRRNRENDRIGRR